MAKYTSNDMVVATVEVEMPLKQERLHTPSTPLAKRGSQETDSRLETLRGASFAEGTSALRPANAVQLEKSADFDRVAEGNIKESEAPESLAMPTSIGDGLKSAWGDSFPEGKSQEQGGVIVKRTDGSYELKRANDGTSGSMTPNYNDVKSRETLIGVGHTHPYDATEGGHTGVSFSGADLARLALVDDKIAVVEAGGTQFIAARTAEFNKLVYRKSRSKKRTLFKEMNAHWNKIFGATGGGIVKMAEAATKSTCAKYHLLYYRGPSSGKLMRVDTSK